MGLDPRRKNACVYTLAGLGVTEDLSDAEFLAVMERHKEVDPHGRGASATAIKATVEGGVGKLRNATGRARPGCRVHRAPTGAVWS
ncbi:hypothetical protein ACIOG7_35835 [Streptomyces sp. NPDC087894]|uniref:hypothetical protein n=1 Tax=Streptomyces sp. NPDC087894 TaxID=3365816 RepID=UPI00380A087D